MEDPELREFLEPLSLSAVADYSQLIGAKRLEAPRHILKKAPVGLVSLEVDGKEFIEVGFARAAASSVLSTS